MLCNKCGNEVKGGAAFCNMCGNKIVRPVSVANAYHEFTVPQAVPSMIAPMMATSAGSVAAPVFAPVSAPSFETKRPGLAVNNKLYGFVLWLLSILASVLSYASVYMEFVSEKVAGKRIHETLMDVGFGKIVIAISIAAFIFSLFKANIGTLLAGIADFIFFAFFYFAFVVLETGKNAEIYKAKIGDGFYVLGVASIMLIVFAILGRKHKKAVKAARNG